MIKVDGVKSTVKNMEALSKRYSKNIAAALVKGGHLVRGDAVQSIQDVSPGEDVVRYREGSTSYQHKVSKQGDAPNTDTGTLANSIQVEVKPEGVYVGTRIDYAKYLEFGDHPFLVPALEKNRKGIKKLIIFAIKETKK